MANFENTKFWETVAFGQFAPESLKLAAQEGKIDESNYNEAMVSVREIVETAGYPDVATSDHLVGIMEAAGIQEANKDVTSLLEKLRNEK